MSPDDRIAAFLTAARPAVEPAFDAAVMQRVARQAFVRSLMTLGGFALVGALALWAAAPVLATALEPAAQSLGTGVAVLAVTFSLLALGERIFRPA
ncbi:hypothetical protein GVN21_06680 [Caulobacter sp. SLTY]|uniref:hypothetical protein n=1 Tax=Caulobacter sp. SLTY TaxID=2683262 RepID=UPI001412E945|nr:hypothetical protein [Caulobacter sp. SLTY]NBB15038.1 hypothetical protein [Caulobacter sp. SLTY]